MSTLAKLGILVWAGLFVSACSEEPSDVTPGDPQHATPYPDVLDSEPPQEPLPEEEQEQGQEQE